MFENYGLNEPSTADLYAQLMQEMQNQQAGQAASGTPPVPMMGDFGGGGLPFGMTPADVMAIKQSVESRMMNPGVQSVVQNPQLGANLDGFGMNPGMGAPINDMAAQQVQPQIGGSLAPTGQRDTPERREALGHIAEARSLQRLLRPPMPPSVFDQAQQQVVQGVMGMLGNVFGSMGSAPVPPQMVMGGVRQGPLVGQGRQPQQAQQPKQAITTWKDVSDDQLQWFKAGIDERIARLKEESAGERRAGRRSILQNQITKLEQDQKRLDAEIEDRRKRIANEEKRTEIAAGAQTQRGEIAENKRSDEEWKSFGSRIDAINNPVDSQGNPIKLKPESVRRKLEMLVIEYEARGKKEIVDILNKMIAKLPPSEEKPKEGTSSPAKPVTNGPPSNEDDVMFTSPTP